MDPICIVVISTMSIVILGQVGRRIYQKYFKNEKVVLLAQFDPNTEMGLLL